MWLSKRQKVLTERSSKLSALDVSSAVAALKKFDTDLPKGVKPCKFDQTVSLAVRLGIDPKQADQIVRGSIVLPNGIGKSKTVLVFCQGANVDVALKAGAAFAGGN